MFYKIFFTICCVLNKSYIREKFCSWDLGRNALNQSDCRIFKSIISPEQINETASFLACWYKFTKLKSWVKIFWFGMVKNGYDQSVLWTLKFTVSQEWTEGINWFLHVGTNSCKLKGDWKVLRLAWSKIGVASQVMGL